MLSPSWKLECATKRGDPVWKRRVIKVRLGGQGILDIVPKEKVEQELRPTQRAKWTQGRAVQSPDSRSNIAAMGTWMSEESQKNNEVISQLSPQSVGLSWSLTPSSGHTGSEYRVGEREGGEIWHRPMNLAESIPHMEIEQRSWHQEAGVSS